MSATQNRRRVDHPVAQLRDALGLSLRAFATEIGRTGGYIWQVEERMCPMGAETALLIAERWRKEMLQLGITVEDLVERID